jgi:hypothetical protein
LSRSTILDSGATCHVFTDRTRFHDFRPAAEDDFLIAGNTTIPIMGFGSVNVTVWSNRKKNKTRTITLLDMAFVPSFHVNIASLRKFYYRNAFWNTETLTLSYEGVVYGLQKLSVRLTFLRMRLTAAV